MNRDGSASCSMQTLAKGSVGHIQGCAHCGCMALTVGPITLRFEAAAMESLWNTLGEALMARHARERAEGERSLMHRAPRGSA